MWSLSKKRMHPGNKEKKAILMTVLIAIVVTLGITGTGFMDNTLQVEAGHLEISGPYGTKIPLEDIDSVYLVDKRPEVSRVRGYQMGYRKKGRFRNRQGEEIQMLIASRTLPWIVIQRKNGRKIYYSHARVSNRRIYEDLVQALPQKAVVPSQ